MNNRLIEMLGKVRAHEGSHTPGGQAVDDAIAIVKLMAVDDTDQNKVGRAGAVIAKWDAPKPWCSCVQGKCKGNAPQDQCIVNAIGAAQSKGYADGHADARRVE